jgi:metal-responsive CopG/Arc/MetJ family transcriptional regulator
MKVTISISENALKELDRQAAQEDRSRSGHIAELVKKEMKK